MSAEIVFTKNVSTKKKTYRNGREYSLDTPLAELYVRKGFAIFKNERVVEKKKVSQNVKIEKSDKEFKEVKEKLDLVLSLLKQRTISNSEEKVGLQNGDVQTTKLDVYGEETPFVPQTKTMGGNVLTKEKKEKIDVNKILEKIKKTRGK